MTKHNKKDPPLVHSAITFICDECNRVHLVMYDEDQKPLAQFACDDERWKALLHGIRDALKSRHVN
jgi:membrane-bound inhibitor of C-type lysozyme